LLESVFIVACRMAFADLTTQQLQRLIDLVKEKEVLQSKLDQINGQLEALESGSPTKKVTSTIGQSSRSKRRGKLKESILKGLESAGAAGIAVKELAAKLGANRQSVAVWFYTTGKKIKGIKKIGPTKYSYTLA
jgi:hypothetical protein